MLSAPSFVHHAAMHGFRFYTGVPCSFLAPLINCAIETGGVKYVGAANEGDAVAMASGAELGGHRAVVMIQNSGLGNAVSPLSSLNAVFDIPVLMLVTLRGDPEGPADEPQHELMGKITGSLLDQLEIRWEFLPAGEALLPAALDRAVDHMTRFRRPFAFLVKRDALSAHPLQQHSRRAGALTRREPLNTTQPWPEARPSRREVLEAVQRASDPALDIIVATTGYTGRLLYALADRSNQLALVGSMGCAASVGLGLALTHPTRRVIILDGDGAILMHLGALATIGHECPGNLVHICLDNEAHDSTGGQATVTHALDLAQLASTCGYTAERAPSAAELAASLAGGRTGLRFIHVKTVPGESASLPRPSISPRAAARRLREHLGA